MTLETSELVSAPFHIFPMSFPDARGKVWGPRWQHPLFVAVTRKPWMGEAYGHLVCMQGHLKEHCRYLIEHPCPTEDQIVYVGSPHVRLSGAAI